MAKRTKKPKVIGNTTIPLDLPVPTPGRDLSFEDKLRISTLICEIYGETRYTLDSILSQFGIQSHTTFLKWRKEITEINGLYKEAVAERSQAYKGSLREVARTALERAITGDIITLKQRKFEPVYKRDKDGNLTDKKVGDLLVEETEKDVFVRPNVTAIIFALTNVDSDNFKRDPSFDPDRGKSDYEDWTEDQLDEELKRLDEQIGNQGSEDPETENHPGEA